MAIPPASRIKAPKAAKRERHGVAYWLERDGAVLLSRRPPRGLLGGMRALPGGAWSEAGVEPSPPAPADWQPIGTVRHVFTHFALKLDLLAARHTDTEAEGELWPVDRLEDAGLPTLYGKAAALAAAWREAA